MCNEYFDLKDLENQVNPCSETPSSGGGNENPGNENPGGGNEGNNCGSDLGANNGGNVCGIYNCSSHKGPVDPDPNWGVGGLSLGNSENKN